MLTLCFGREIREIIFSYTLLSGSTQEDPSLHNLKIVDRTLRIKSNKETKLTGRNFHSISQGPFSKIPVAKV